MCNFSGVAAIEISFLIRLMREEDSATDKNRLGDLLDVPIACTSATSKAGRSSTGYFTHQVSYHHLPQNAGSYVEKAKTNKRYPILGSWLGPTRFGGARSRAWATILELYLRNESISFWQSGSLPDHYSLGDIRDQNLANPSSHT